MRTSSTGSGMQLGNMNGLGGPGSAPPSQASTPSAANSKLAGYGEPWQCMPSKAAWAVEGKQGRCMWLPSSLLERAALRWSDGCTAVCTLPLLHGCVAVSCALES